MAYVNVAEWKPEQVTEWLKGLDNNVFQYVHSFLNNEVNGKQLLNLRTDDLDHLGVLKLGHQELILEAVEHLRNFHYELDRENLQFLALRLACQARSLYNELKQKSDLQPLSTQNLADVANVIMAVKPLVCWLERSPFSGQFSYQERKDDLLHLSLQIATCAQRDRFADKPVEEIRSSCKMLAELGDEIIQDIVDPLILQPASLDLVTLKKRAIDDLGFFILPSFHGIHQIAEINFSSPAHQCGKIENGDEIVQVNYQTVVGWQTKKVMALFEESPTEVFLTLKKRPRHNKVYGQIYMKPYRLPSKKRLAPYSRWNDNLPSPRPELLTIPDFEIPLSKGIFKKGLPQSHSLFECNSALCTLTTEEKKEDGMADKFESVCKEEEDDDDDNEDDNDDESFLPETADDGQASPTSMRLYLPKPRVTVQRRATVTGASPTSKRAPVNVEQFWAELRLERHWRECAAIESGNRGKCDLFQMRDKSISVGNSLSFHLSRPCTTLGIEMVVSKIKSPDEHEALMRNENSRTTTKTMQNVVMDAENITDQGAVDNCEENCSFNLEENKTGSVSFAEKKFLIKNDEILNNVENDLYTIVSQANSLCVVSPEMCEEQVCEESTCKKTGSDFSVINFPIIDQCDSQIDNNSGVVSQDVLEHNNMFNWENESKIRLQKYNLDNSNGNVCESTVCESTDKYSSNQLTQMSGKERGRLDKSYSTPAYDLLESITFLEKSADFHESRITDRCGNGGDGTLTDVNNSTLQTHVEQDSLPCVPNATCTQPTFFNDDFNTNNSFKELDNNLTIQSKVVSCMLKPNIASLSNEEENNSSIGSHLQYSSLEKQPSGNNISVLPVESNSENLDSSLFTQIDTDLFHEKKIPGNIAGSQCSFNVNIHSEKSHITCVTETKCISIPEVISDQTLTTYNSIKEVGSHSSNISGISQNSVDCMCKVKKNSKVSPKCETSKRSVKITSTHDTEKYGLGSESVGKKTATKGFPTASIPSPWSTRKGNSLFSKRRSVSAKEIGCGDNDGWLLHRFRSSGAGATWLNMWFILKGVVFYGFKTPQATKAHVMIVLPGFTVSVAEEVKSRSFAFKIYHTGTVFYFSADTADDFSVWLACLSVAANPQKSIKTCSGFNSQTPYFSETDDDFESQKESESETSIYKHFSYKSEHGSSQQHGKSHQNSITEPNKTGSPKLFGSRKKIARKSETMGSRMCTELLEPASSSLDRKYLNFLGGIRNSNVPVPTAQFRSYRRAPKKIPMEESKLHGGKSYQVFDNVCLPRRNDKLTSSFVDNKSDTQDVPINNLKRSTAHTEDLLPTPQDVLLSEGNRSCNMSDISTEESDSFVRKHKIGMHLKVETKEKIIPQSHKLLKVHNVRNHHIHASNPNLHLSSNMFNYRLAAERLRKFGLGHNQQEGTSGFVTLENLMSRQEEEKSKQQQLNLNSMSSDGVTSISSHHFLDPPHANFVKDIGHKLKDFEVNSSSGVPCETKIYNEIPAVPACKKGNFINMQQYSNTPQDVRVNSSVTKHASSTLAQNSALAVDKVVSRLETNTAISSNRKRTNLKSAAQYHPPPISKVLAGGRKVHPKEDGPKMKLAFEMHLGENTLSTAPNKDTFCKSSKFRNLFLFSRNQNVKYSHGDNSVSVCGEQRKQLLGSPRLHRTFPWEKPVYGSKKTPNVFSFIPVTHPSFSLVPPSWNTDLSDLQSDCSIPQVKPMMGVAMICKKPCKVVMASSSPSQSSSSPDYPGLEYPPVFEPETYTLSDANTLLKSRHHHLCANNISCACSTLCSNQTKKEQ